MLDYFLIYHVFSHFLLDSCQQCVYAFLKILRMNDKTPVIHVVASEELYQDGRIESTLYFAGIHQ